MNIVATVQKRLKHGIECGGQRCHQFSTMLCVSAVQQHRWHGMSTPMRYLHEIGAEVNAARNPHVTV